jgi:hypothetical protein
MDPLVFMDYAEDLNPGIMLIGFVIFFSATIIQFDLVSNFLDVELSIVESLIFMGYGASTFIGGFLQGEAENLEYLVDISAAVGFVLLFGESITQLLVSEGLWFKISLLTFLFLSIPSTLAVWYTRESIYESRKFGPRSRFD